jgi:hypothetical protein
VGIRIRVMQCKQGTIPWFAYVICIITVVIIITNRDALRDYCRRDEKT